jgi:hypothetical protein
MAAVTRYGVEVDGHHVELEFDQKLAVLNRARLFADGVQVDAAQVFYGDKELTATLADGTPVHVVLSSGMYGELVRAQLRRSDGSLVDLTEVTSGS